MKKITNTILASTLILGSTAMTAQAAEPHLYAGLKAGSFLVDMNGADDPMPFGLQLGYDFGRGLSAEFEYNTGSSDIKILGSDVDMDVTTMAIYAAFRTPGKGYFLAKLGLISEEVELSAAGNSISEDDTGMSYGLGGGYNFGEKFALEGEYTIIEEDVDYIGVTARFKF
jgi:opacity protein-like surface antigen